MSYKSSKYVSCSEGEMKVLFFLKTGGLECRVYFVAWNASYHQRKQRRVREDGVKRVRSVLNILSMGQSGEG